MLPMAKNFKRSYRFAVKTSLLLTFTLSLFTGGFTALVGFYSWKFLLVYSLLTLLISFFLIQYRLEFFIYKKIKKIYESVSFISSSSVRPGNVTTDMATLSREVEKFAEGKKLEIEALKVRDSYRKEFMGNISHELKTPLFTVQGYILTLQDGAINDKKVRMKYIDRAAKGVDRLVYIVKDLDMITKLETGELRLKMVKFDLLEVVQGVFELLEMKAAKKKISLRLEKQYEPVWVKADKERIRQVLTNLLVNSVKYGKTEGTTELSISDYKKKKIIVRVKDDGEGIEKEHLPRLFERFYRVDKSGSRKEGGAGLGLAIVKHLLEAHNEKIFVKSVYGRGSEFSFTLKKTKKPAEVTDEGGMV